MPPVNHSLNHPDIHSPWSEWSEDQTLHVAVCYSNPFRWRTRRELANNCIRHLRNSPNVKVYVGELAYGARPFEIAEDIGHFVRPIVSIPLRTTCELFHKEDIANRVIQNFDVGWKYGAMIDADFHFTRHDWALETIHQLQHYDFVQCFSSYADLSGNIYGQKNLPVHYNSGFFFNYHQNGFEVSPVFHNSNVPNGVVDEDGYEGAMFRRGVGATGGAIAFRKTAFDAVGGFPNRCILGHADWYVAYSLVGIQPPDIHTQNYHPDYKHYVESWRERAQVIKKNVGYVDGHANHFFHGSKTRRAYSSRDKILAKHQYSPYTDVFPDSQGILQLTPNKPALRDEIRQYFVSRTEDDPNLYGSERPLV